jgi:redox-sensitive bicupin YhaK (pirin superfamily)
MDVRELQRVLPGQLTSDGAGVKLRRSIGASAHARVDPVLMLDEFYSDRAEDYLAGFPSHPHRGFETVTYMLDGQMLHEDHLGNRGLLGPGDVQWMSAARGIIHSEMPMQQSGRMRGFQLWINLAAADKMRPANYRDIPAAQLTQVQSDAGHRLKLIAGRLDFAGTQHAGPINRQPGEMRTDPIYADLELPPGSELQLALPAGHNTVLYAFENAVEVVGAVAARALPCGQAGVLSAGTQLRLRGSALGSRLLLLAAAPLREPVVQYGPFVMNTREEIEQALADFRDGRLTA